jgi:hypothetical protein
VLASRIAAILSSRRLPWALAALASLLVAPSIGMGLVVDDYGIRAIDLGHEKLATSATPFDTFRFTTPAQVPGLVDRGVLPWWTSPQLKLAFFRPLASITHWLDFKLFPDAPAAMHVVNIAWLAATVVLAAVLYRRLLGVAWVAGLAACFFAFDPGHAVAAGWIATRNALLAACFGIASLYAHDRWRRDGERPAAIVSALCCAASLAAGESGAATLALLFAHAVAFEGPALAPRARALAPATIVALLWAAAYRGLGYGTAHSAMYADPIASPASYLRAAAIAIPINLGARLGGPPAAICTFLAERALPILALAGLAFAIAVAAALARSRRDPAVRFFALGAVLAALPIAGTMPSDRNLFFVGFAAFGLLALVVQRAADARSWPRRAHAGWLLLTQLAIAIPSMPANARSLDVFARVSRDPLSRVLLDDAVARQTVVFVNPPSQFFVSHFESMRVGTKLPIPARVRALVPGIYPARVTRTRADQLAIHVDGGMLPLPGHWPPSAGPAPAFKFEYVAQHLGSFVRGRDEPMRAGETVSMPGCRVQIVAATPEGGPSDVTFTFDEPLDDASMRWMLWQGDGYVPFVVPPVGSAVDLAPATITL